MKRLLLTLWLTLHLLLAQQFAMAHLVGHIGVGQTQVVAEQAGDGDASHGTAEALAHVCLGCVAGLALDAACPPPAFGLLAVAATPGAAVGAASPAPSFARPAYFHSRAPPLLHN